MLQTTLPVAKRKQVVAPWAQDESFGDYCREILHSLDWPNRNSELRSLGITSCQTCEGVSTVAWQIAAAAAAQNEGPVLLVDANLRRPSVSDRFDLANSPGLLECLQEEATVNESVQALMQANLWALTAGGLCKSPAQAFNSPKLRGLIHEMAKRFELVVFDLPPVGVASCMQQLTVTLDGVLLVVEANSTRWDSAQRVNELLQLAGARVRGSHIKQVPQCVLTLGYRSQ